MEGLCRFWLVVLTRAVVSFLCLTVSLSASVFLTVLRGAPVVLINTVANLETLYAGGMIQVSVTVCVVSMGGFDRRSSMAPRWLLAVLPRLAPPLCYFLSIYLREKATAFLFGVLRCDGLDCSRRSSWCHAWSMLTSQRLTSSLEFVWWCSLTFLCRGFRSVAAGLSVCDVLERWYSSRCGGSTQDFKLLVTAILLYAPTNRNTEGILQFLFRQERIWYSQFVIAISTGGADPLADSTLSSEEIISRVVDRKVVVNIVSAKTVDQLGQAYVRSLISIDEEGEDLYRGLGGKEDTSVDTMVALIDDDYPFEHNTWSGGVKADEVKLKKGHAQTSESSDENVPEPVEKDNAHHGGVESGGYPGDPRGKSSANPSGAPHGGESFHFDVQTLLRRAADAYEEKVIAMYEGYILSLKGHFNSEVGGLRTDLQAATSAIAHLEIKVTGEFDKINQLLKSRLRGADMGPTYGFSPERHSSPFPGQNDDFNNSEVNPDRPTTHTGASDGMGTHTKFVSTQRDGEDVAGTGTASVGLGQNLDEGEMGGGLSPGKQTDSTDGVEFRAETGGEHRGDAHIGHDPINVENPSPLVNVASPYNADAANPPSRVDVVRLSRNVISSQNDQVNVSSEFRIDDPLSGVVNKILAEAGVDKDPLRPSTGSGTDVPQTSADVILDKVGLDGVHDDRGEAAVVKKGEDVDEDDVTITKVQAGRGNTDAACGQADGGRRFSRRTHTSTKSYTPPAPTVRGFSPFTPPTPAAREAFLKIMAEAKSNAPSLGSVISIASLDDVFNCTGVCSYEAVDRVVGWIRKRRDSNPSSKFDFIPPTFFMDLIRSYPAFEAMQDKAAFTFPMSLRSQFMHRPQWFTQVDFLYTLILVKDRHWVGMIVDLAMWAIYVVDANHTCPPISVVKDVVNPISIMMPHMISRFCLTSRPRELNYLPFPISRIDIPVLLEHPGYAAVVALILLEIAAVGNLLIDLSLTEEEVHVAAENYAISTLGMFKVVPTNPAV
ncbi:hypothetical protein Bca4012_049383 [Brassica carinata]